jgi:SAM-dependent methyltransferase
MRRRADRESSAARARIAITVRRAIRSGRTIGARALRKLASVVDLPEPPATTPVPSFASPWVPVADPGKGRVVCNICRWTGDSFIDPGHCELTICPSCNSIGRDRFLFHCWMSKGPVRPGLRVLETSPRLGAAYLDAMGGWFDYVASDYDERAHKANARLDVQALDVPDQAFDVILTPHVLEHVPDTDRALSELRRVLAPGGRMFLQVPVLQGLTAPPTEPEFHGDNTPVFWRFGFDLTARLRDHGFDTTLLCLQPWAEAVESAVTEWPTETAPEVDVADMLKRAIADDLDVVADATAAERLGLTESYMYLTWACAPRSTPA